MSLEQLPLAADQSFIHDLGSNQLGFDAVNGATVESSYNDVEELSTHVNTVRSYTSTAIRELLARPGARRLAIGQELNYTADSGKTHRVTVAGYAENDTKIALKMENGLQFMVKAKADNLVRFDTTDKIISIRRPEEERGTDYEVGEKIIYRKTNGETIEAYLHKGPNVSTFRIQPLAKGARGIFIGSEGLGRIEKTWSKRVVEKGRGLMKGAINVGVAAGIAVGTMGMLTKTASASTGDGLYDKPFMSLDGRYATPNAGYINPLNTDNPDVGWGARQVTQLADNSAAGTAPPPPLPASIAKPKGESQPPAVPKPTAPKKPEPPKPTVKSEPAAAPASEVVETKDEGNKIWNFLTGFFDSGDDEKTTAKQVADVTETSTNSLEGFKSYTIHTKLGDVSFNLKTSKPLTSSIELVEKAAGSDEVMIMLADGTVLFEDVKNVKYSAGGDEYSIEKVIAEDGTLAQAKENIYVKANVNSGYGGISGNAEIGTHVSVPDMPVEVGGGLKFSYGEGVHEQVIDLAAKLGVSFTAMEQQTIGFAIAVGTNRLKAGPTLTQQLESGALELYASIEHVETLLKKEQPDLGSITFENVEMATIGGKFKRGVQEFSVKFAKFFSADAIDQAGNPVPTIEVGESWYGEIAAKTPFVLGRISGELDSKIYGATGDGDGSIYGIYSEVTPGEKEQGVINDALNLRGENLTHSIYAGAAKEETVTLGGVEDNINARAGIRTDWQFAPGSHMQFGVGGAHIAGENYGTVDLKFYSDPGSVSSSSKESVWEKHEREDRHYEDRAFLKLKKANDQEKKKILESANASLDFFARKQSEGKLRNNLDRAYQVLLTKSYVEGSVEVPNFNIAKSVAQYVVKEFAKRGLDPAYSGGNLQESLTFQVEEVKKIFNSWKLSPMYNAAEVAQLESYIQLLDKVLNRDRKTNSFEKSQLIRELRNALENVDATDPEIMKAIVNAAIKKVNTGPGCEATFEWSVTDGDTLTINTGTLDAATHSCVGYSVTYSATGVEAGNVFVNRQVLGAVTPDIMDVTATLRNGVGSVISTITRNITVNP